MELPEDTPITIMSDTPVLVHLGGNMDMEATCFNTGPLTFINGNHSLPGSTIEKFVLRADRVDESAMIYLLIFRTAANESYQVVYQKLFNVESAGLHEIAVDFTASEGDRFGFCFPLPGVAVPIPYRVDHSSHNQVYNGIAVLGGSNIYTVRHEGSFPFQVVHHSQATSTLSVPVPDKLDPSKSGSKFVVCPVCAKSVCRKNIARHIRTTHSGIDPGSRCDILRSCHPTRKNAAHCTVSPTRCPITTCGKTVQKIHRHMRSVHADFAAKDNYKEEMKRLMSRRAPPMNPTPSVPEHTDEPAQADTRTADSLATDSSSPPMRRDSLHNIKSREHISQMSACDLKTLLSLNFVSVKGCVEKRELVERVEMLWDGRQRASTLSDEDLCKICFDAPQNCVLLECGHVVTCVYCGKILAECPVCRCYVSRVVRIFKA